MPGTAITSRFSCSSDGPCFVRHRAGRGPDGSRPAAVAARMARMDAQSGQSVANLIAAAEQNMHRPANVAAGVGTRSTSRRDAGSCAAAARQPRSRARLGPITQQVLYRARAMCIAIDSHTHGWRMRTNCCATASAKSSISSCRETSSDCPAAADSRQGQRVERGWIPSRIGGHVALAQCRVPGLCFALSRRRNRIRLVKISSEQPC